MTKEIEVTIGEKKFVAPLEGQMKFEHTKKRITVQAYMKIKDTIYFRTSDDKLKIAARFTPDQDFMTGYKKGEIYTLTIE